MRFHLYRFIVLAVAATLFRSPAAAATPREALVVSTAELAQRLNYAGLGDRVSLLDGGQPAWVRDGQPVTTVVPEIQGGVLSPLETRPTVVRGLCP